MEAVIVAVVTIFVVAGAIEVIVGGRGRGVPILKLNETDADEIPQHRHVIMDDLMRAKVEGRPAVVLLLRHGHNDLVRNQVGVRAPRGHKELPLVIGVSKASASGSAVSTLALADPRMAWATSDDRACAGTPFNPTRTR